MCDQLRWRAANLAAQILRSAGENLSIRELEDGVTSVVLAAWSDVFPSLVDAAVATVIAGGTAEDVDASIGKVLDPWPSETRTKSIIAWIADAFASGKGDVLGVGMRSTTRRPPASVGVARNPAGDMDPLNVLGDAIPNLVDSLDDFAEMMSQVAPDAFAVTDYDAARWLGRDTMWWVGSVHSTALGREIADTVANTMAQGGRLEEQANALRSALGSRFGRPQSYWRTVASAVTSRARNFGAVSGFEAGEISRYVIQAVVDETTSQICLEMDGKIFDVSHAVELRNDLLATETPEDAKAISPWLSEGDFLELASQGDDALLELGFALPPYHGRCRTKVAGL